jgi:hypothetical protein
VAILVPAGDLPVLTLVHEGCSSSSRFSSVRVDETRRRARRGACLWVPYMSRRVPLRCHGSSAETLESRPPCVQSLTSMAVSPDVCGGATAALERYDVQYGSGDIQRYLPLAILTFSPLLWYGAQAISAPRRRRFLAGVCLAGLSTAPLYVVSEDWGRWLHVTGMLMLVTTLACRDAHVRLPPGVQRLPSPLSPRWRSSCSHGSCHTGSTRRSPSSVHRLNNFSCW